MKHHDLKTFNIATKVIHVGGEPDKETGAIMPPIFQTTTFAQSSPGKHKGYEYSRSHNPTRTRLEKNLAALEGAKYALAMSSGMAVATLMIKALKSGSTIVCGADVYGGTYRLFTTVLNEDYNFVFVDTTNPEKVEHALKAHKPALLWIETPTNPLLKITDIKKTTTLAKKYKALTMVDNTFMSPIFQNPLELGANFVMHSMTKYINGHSDVIGGCLMTNQKPWYDKIWYLQNSIGPSQSPFDSWLVLRGIKTLVIRMREHERNAMKVAKFLETHKQVDKVIYPGLKSHPEHKIAKKQMKGFGGMITFYLKGEIKESKKFLSTVKLFALAESLGGVESLIEHPGIMTHHSMPKKVREEIGIHDNLIRLSVGIEHIDDLIADLEKGFKAIK